ncbi:hypothetical protein BG015_002216 [Linnemannia schmuckeri]|uniref:Uncharacterized protein n=1 Tax=Linnemannia schmuckeri TaxID=64567 RepID=A0A9P5S363_9FUNG|nr:hypothetical protein BG015_002216 [Linnemannia schmuckeri]
MIQQAQLSSPGTINLSRGSMSEPAQPDIKFQLDKGQEDLQRRPQSIGNCQNRRQQPVVPPDASSPATINLDRVSTAGIVSLTLSSNNDNGTCIKKFCLGYNSGFHLISLKCPNSHSIRNTKRCLKYIHPTNFNKIVPTTAGSAQQV